jgi:tRNA threonylcarbamoyladenosine biosynthesis protein TsaE
MNEQHLFLADHSATEAIGAQLWHFLPEKCLVFLNGHLGSGKTTLVRGLLKAAGVTGTVKSPTYTIVEEYDIAHRKIFHFDLYRLADADELEWIGIDDYLNQSALCFIEWADKGADHLPKPDLNITLETRNDGRFIAIENHSTKTFSFMICKNNNILL